MLNAILAFLIVLLGLCVTLEIISLLLKTRKKKRFYEVLARRVTQLRLSKMLQFLGADVDEYIHKVPASDINMHIHRCWRCSEHDTCDSCLRDGKHIAEMKFCPNHQSLTKHSRTLSGKS